MRIAYLAAGAAGMYCGSCLHDNTLARALLDLGEDVILAPIYTPIRTDEVDVSQSRVFFGGINAYLQQKFRLFRHTPVWLDRWLDHPALLRLLAGRGASVDPAKLGDMTVSMLRGEEGNQAKELAKLVDWLLEEVQPDVVHLSNSMMLGLARMISQRCGPPVVCSLSGEDIFLEKLRPPHYEQARALLRERAAEVDAFVALNHYYADFMADYLSVERGRVHVIPHGLDLSDRDERPARIESAPLRIGYLARICHDKGLHLLVEACERLVTEHKLENIELHAAGYLGPSDRGYLQNLIRQAERGPLAGKFKHHGELDRREKLEFLASLDLFSTPTVYRESKGLPALEAMSVGTPVVMPNHGSFSELVESTQGGVLHEPLNSSDLAVKLSELLQNPDRRGRLGQAARSAIAAVHDAQGMAKRTLKLYSKLKADQKDSPREPEID
jgi:glycosyltransferase involved in cell wall biosynthesis